MSANAVAVNGASGSTIKTISQEMTPQISYEKIDLPINGKTVLSITHPFKSSLTFLNDSKIHYDTINNTINTISTSLASFSTCQAKTTKKRRILQTYARPQRTIGYSENDDFAAAVNKNEEVFVSLQCNEDASLADFDSFGSESNAFSKNNKSSLLGAKKSAKSSKTTRTSNKITDFSLEEDDETDFVMDARKKRKYNKQKKANGLPASRPKRMIKSRLQKQEEQDELDEKTVLYAKQMKKLKAVRAKEKHMKEAIRKLEKGLSLTSATSSATSLLEAVNASEDEDLFVNKYAETGEINEKDESRPLYPQALPSKKSRRTSQPNFNQFDEKFLIPQNILIRKLSIKDTVAKTSDELRRETYLLGVLKKRAEQSQDGDNEPKDAPKAGNSAELEQAKADDFEGYNDFILVGADAYSPEMLHEMQEVKKGRKIRKDYVLPPEPTCETKDALIEGRKWRAARMYLLNPLRTSLREVCKENNVSVPTLITYMDATRVARSLMTGKYSGSSIIRDSTFNNRGKNKYPKEVRDEYLKRAYEKLNEARSKAAQITNDLGLRERHRGLRLIFDSPDSSSVQPSPGPSASSNSSAVPDVNPKGLTTGSPLVMADTSSSSSSSSSPPETNPGKDATPYAKSYAVELHMPKEGITIVDVSGTAKSEEISNELKSLDSASLSEKRTRNAYFQKNKIKINDVSFEPLKFPNLKPTKNQSERAFIEEDPAKMILEEQKKVESVPERKFEKAAAAKQGKLDRKKQKEPTHGVYFRSKKRLLEEINQTETVPKTINISNENTKKSFVVKPYELDQKKLRVAIPSISVKPEVHTFSKSSSKGYQLRKLFKQFAQKCDDPQNGNCSIKEAGALLEKNTSSGKNTSSSTEQPKNLEGKYSLENSQSLEPKTQVDSQATKEPLALAVALNTPNTATSEMKKQQETALSAQSPEIKTLLDHQSTISENTHNESVAGPAKE